MVDYILRRLNISFDTFHSINWNVIGKVCQQHDINCIGRTSNMIYELKPVGDNWQKYKLRSNRCPCCGSPDETVEHLLGYKNNKLEYARREASFSIQNECVQLEIPLYFTATLLKAIKVTLEGTTPPTIAEHDPLSRAVMAQANSVTITW